MTIAELAAEYARYTSAAELAAAAPATVQPNTTITGTCA
jgi:hypothetical protein